jgi:hypothetical protein
MSIGYPNLTDPISNTLFKKSNSNLTLVAAPVSIFAIELTKVVPIFVQSGMYPFIPLNS